MPRPTPGATPEVLAPVRRLPGRLTAPDPGWSVTADVVVIGSGIAGLTAALRLKEELGPEGGAVVLERGRMGARAHGRAGTRGAGTQGTACRQRSTHR